MNAQIQCDGIYRLLEATVRLAERDLRYSGPPRYGMPTATDKLTAGAFLAYMRGEDDTPWPEGGIDGGTITKRRRARNRAC